MTAPHPILRAADLAFAYHPDKPVLRGASLSLHPGRVAVLLGPNASGKSTLLRVLLGELSPAAGSVEWDARPLAAWRPRDLARHVAYLPQSPLYDPEQTVLDVLRTGRTPYLRVFGIESERDADIVRRTADLLALGDVLDRPVGQLSGGQRQRVFLGRALAQEPRALLLDEPNTFLDLRHQVELGRLLRDLARRHDLAVLAASHDLNLAGAFADELVLLHDGHVAAAGPPADVLRADLLSHVYGLPMERLDRPDGVPVVLPVW